MFISLHITVYMSNVQLLQNFTESSIDFHFFLSIYSIIYITLDNKTNL